MNPLYLPNGTVFKTQDDYNQIANIARANNNGWIKFSKKDCPGVHKLIIKNGCDEMFIDNKCNYDTADAVEWYEKQTNEVQFNHKNLYDYITGGATEDE